MDRKFYQCSVEIEVNPLEINKLLKSKVQSNLSMVAYGADTYIALLDSPGVAGQGHEGTDFCRLMTNSLNESVRLIILNLVILAEEADARKEKVKVFYPQVSIYLL